MTAVLNPVTGVLIRDSGRERRCQVRVGAGVEGCGPERREAWGPQELAEVGRTLW